MAAFYRFPDLPYELRAQIWQQAIRPSAKGYSGIQHFSILYKHVLINDRCPLHETARLFKIRRTFPENTRTIFTTSIPGTNKEDKGQVNRSAYIWDAGLWTACRESRQIIMRHWEMAKWLEKRRAVQYYWIHDWFLLESWKEHKELCTTINAPALSTSDGHQDWQLMVRPYQDAFYIDLKSLQEAFNQPAAFLTCRLQDVMADLPFSSGRYGCQQVRNLIFDFDPDWINDMPFHGDIDGDSLGACIAALLKDIAEEKIDCHIWLIDRSLRQSSMEKEDGYAESESLDGAPLVFYNCDEEFVDLGMGGFEGGRWPRYEAAKEEQIAQAKEENTLAGWFIWMLSQPSQERYFDCIEGDIDPIPDMIFAEEHISVLGYRK